MAQSCTLKAPVVGRFDIGHVSFADADLSANTLCPQDFAKERNLETRQASFTLCDANVFSPILFMLASCLLKVRTTCLYARCYDEEVCFIDKVDYAGCNDQFAHIYDKDGKELL